MGWEVLHVTEAWNAGVGVYVDGLVVQQLRDPRIARVHLACSESRTPESVSRTLAEVSIHKYASSRRPWAVGRSAAALRRVIREVNPDLVHAHSTFAGLYCRMAAPARPVVYCAHGWAFTQEQPAVVRAAYGAVEALLARRAAALVHVSRSESRAARRYGVAAPLDRVVYPGIRAPTRGHVPSLAVDPNRINLAFVGRFDRQKNIELLLSAAADLARTDVHFYLIGDFDREAAKKQNGAFSHPRVTPLGWVPHAEIDAYVSLMDAVVVPSRWEAFGLVAAEAMRNGKAVIVSDRGGLPEQVIHGYNGFVFSLDDPGSLRSVVEKLDKAALSTMGANARHVWETCFTEAPAYSALMDVYAEVIERHRSAQGAPASSRTREKRSK
jgi:glycosyltransferase involved in cell wall biosynthesis